MISKSEKVQSISSLSFPDRSEVALVPDPGHHLPGVNQHGANLFGQLSQKMYIPTFGMHVQLQLKGIPVTMSMYPLHSQ